MDRLLSFDSFWDLAVAHDKQCNSLYYHSCCDLWTTRNSKAKRNSHKTHLSWKKIMASLPKDTEDKKKALQAKMLEKRWRMPVLLNKPCQSHSSTYPNPKFPFRPHVPQHKVHASVFSEDEGHVNPTAANNSSTLCSPSPLLAANSLLAPHLPNSYLATASRSHPSSGSSATG
jgi:hypothetical protein